MPLFSSYASTSSPSLPPISEEEEEEEAEEEADAFREKGYDSSDCVFVRALDNVLVRALALLHILILFVAIVSSCALFTPSPTDTTPPPAVADIVMLLLLLLLLLLLQDVRESANKLLKTSLDLDESTKPLSKQSR